MSLSHSSFSNPRSSSLVIFNHIHPRGCQDGSNTIVPFAKWLFAKYTRTDEFPNNIFGKDNFKCAARRSGLRLNKTGISPRCRQNTHPNEHAHATQCYAIPLFLPSSCLFAGGLSDCISDMIMPPITTSPIRGTNGPPQAFSFGFGMHNHGTSGNAPIYTTATSSTSNTTKRQRSLSPSEESDDTMDAAQSSSAHTPSRSLQALPKRMRAGLGGSGHSSARKSRVSSSHSPPASGPSNSQHSADVGKMLATLDKASLLTVFSRLLTADPSSAERIQGLIPTPTLASVEAALDESQKAVKMLLLNAADMRNEFSWGRLRMPVADFVTTSMSFLPFFVSTDEENTSNPSIHPREPPHPSTMYAFLHLITERALLMMAALPDSPTNLSISLFSPDAANDGHPIVMANETGTPKMILKAYHDAMSSSDMGSIANEKLSAVNPNAIVSQLIPILLLHWARLIDWVARAVNEEGRMFGAETVRGWLAGLEALTTIRSYNGNEDEQERNRLEIRACKLALCAVGRRMQEQIGWLIGRNAGMGWRASNMEF